MKKAHIATGMQIIEKQSYISLQVDDCGKSSHGHWEVVPLYESSPCRRGMVPGDLLLHGFFALFPCTHLLWYVKLISEMWLKIVTCLLFEHLLAFFHVILKHFCSYKFSFNIHLITSNWKFCSIFSLFFTMLPYQKPAGKYYQNIW